MTQENVNLPGCGIIIANKNYGQYISDAIKSAALQDYPNKVIYIVDDASEDNSLEVIFQTVQGDKDVVPLEENDDYQLILMSYGNLPCASYLFKLKKSGGPSRARNFAIKHALENGCDIIAVLDADDHWKQSKLSKCIIEIMKDPAMVGGVYTDYLHLNTETKAISYEAKWAYDRNKLRRESIVHSGAILNGLALKQVGLYDASMRTCEDFHLFRRIADRFIFIHLPEALSIVRVHPQNSTLTINKETWENDHRKAVSIPL